jgi:hypothetical protein
MNLKGLIQINDQPAYAQVQCKTCGAPMVTVAGNTKFVFAGGYPDTVLPSGALPIVRSQKGLFARMLGDQDGATVADPDIGTYPQIENVRADPPLLRPDLYAYLQTTDLFLARQGGKAGTIAVARCPSHHLAIPLAKSPPVGIHVEAHPVEGWLVFGVYVLVWDNPQTPWFAELTVCPYDLIGANEKELAHPCVHGYAWRKLFYLLTQKNTDLIFLDEKHRVAALRSAALRSGQAAQFARLVPLLASCTGKQIAKPDYFKVHTQYGQAVKIEELQARFPHQ